MKHCLVFASLISPSKMILFEKKYQTFDTVFHHQMKHLEVRQKYSAARRIFNSLLGVSSGDETLHLMFDILHDVYFINACSSCIPCEQRLHFRGNSWRAKSSLCRQLFKSVQKSGRINLKKTGFFLFLTGLEHCVSLASANER